MKSGSAPAYQTTRKTYKPKEKHSDNSSESLEVDAAEDNDFKETECTLDKGSSGLWVQKMKLVLIMKRIYLKWSVMIYVCKLLLWFHYKNSMIDFCMIHKFLQ